MTSFQRFTSRLPVGRVSNILVVVATIVIVILQQRIMKNNNWVSQGIADRDAGGLNAMRGTFLRKLHSLTTIALPSWRKLEFYGTASFIVLFGIKAWANVLRAKADSSVVEAVITSVDRRFALEKFIASSLLLATVNGLIEHLRHWLITRYRKTVTQHFHEKLFKGHNFYRIHVAADHIHSGTAITHIVGEFSEHFAELPYYFILPLAEASAALYFLSRSAGKTAASLVCGGTLCTLVFLKIASPKFGRLHSTRLMVEETFRNAHNEVKAHVEQLALHHAGDYMKSHLDGIFHRVFVAAAENAAALGFFTLLQSSISLALWDLMALGLVARMVSQGMPRDIALRRLLVQRQMIRKFHTSTETLIENVKEASHLNEYTQQLCEFEELLNEFDSGKFQSYVKDFDSNQHGTPAPVPSNYHGLARSQDAPDADFSLGPALASNKLQMNPRIRQVIFEGVTVTSPSGVNLVENVHLSIRQGTNWVILGPNGSGKTSILRVLAGLWQPSEGVVRASPDIEMNFLPQSAFLLSHSVLFEQLAFPDPLVDREGRRAIATPTDIKFAKNAMLAAFGQTIVELLGGWSSPYCGFTEDHDPTYAWESLSGGQQQKVALARLFFRAQVLRERGIACFAILDESTSQIDAESEDIIFAKLKEFGITYISVTHRDRCIIHHDQAITVIPSTHSVTVTPVRNGSVPRRTQSGSAIAGIEEENEMLTEYTNKKNG